MSRGVIAGAWYGDHLPSGVFCATVPKTTDRDGYCVTHLRTIALPPGESFGVGFPRCTDVGGFRFAGQAHDTLNPASWEWLPASGWIDHPPPCVGVNPLIYDRKGILRTSDGSVGSQGYRYVTEDNQIVSGDATYGPFNGLFEYTDLGGLWIGQGATDGSGVRVWDGTVLRQLELGDCRFVRANRAGEAVALAFTRPEGVVLIQTTMRELRALPSVTVDPPPPPPHDDDPPEEPMFTPIRLPDAAQAIVQALYLRHKDLALGEDDQRRALAKKIAEQVRFTLGPAWGWKSAGGGRPPSKDTIAFRAGEALHGYDLFNGATREPNDRPMSLDLAGQEFIEVQPVNHLGSVVDQPPPPPPTDVVTKAQFDAAIAKVRADVARDLDSARSAMRAEMAAEVATLRREIAAVTTDPAAVKAVVAAELATYEATGKTSTAFAHQHTVRLELKKKA